MAPLGKWLEGLRPDASVSDAARLSLEVRMAAVAYWLPLAARPSDDDPEKVHQLRVSSRRAMAALTLYRDWLPRGTARWLRKRLKRVRRAAGAARDMDVLGQRLERHLGRRGVGLLEIVAQRRAAAQPPIRQAAQRVLRQHRLHHKIGKLVGKIGPRGEAAQRRDESFHRWAGDQLSQVADDFFAAMPPGADDLEALHQFRIEGKRLRYTMELVAPACGPALRKVHYSAVERLQERLGAINDGQAGIDYLRRWRQELDRPALQTLLDEQIAHEQAGLQVALDRYRTEWTHRDADKLRAGLGLPAAGTGPSCPPPEVAPHRSRLE